MTIILLWFIISIIDSALGMLYWTILSPILLLFYAPVYTIPAILFSQWLWWIIAWIRHHKYSHANFSLKKDSDIKTALFIIIPWIIATITWVILVIKLNPIFIKSYTSILVIIIWIMIVLNKKLVFSNKKTYILPRIRTFWKNNQTD